MGDAIDNQVATSESERCTADVPDKRIASKSETASANGHLEHIAIKLYQGASLKETHIARMSHV
jgi:hypothetical protein